MPLPLAVGLDAFDGLVIMRQAARARPASPDHACRSGESAAAAPAPEDNNSLLGAHSRERSDDNAIDNGLGNPGGLICGGWKMARIRVGVGQSKQEDSSRAGEEAARAALSRLDGPADVLVVFVDPRFNHRQLLAGVEAAAGKIPMVGGTTAGEISSHGFSTGSVVVMAIASSELAFITGVGQYMSRDEAACAASLSQDLLDKLDGRQPLSLLVFPNGMGGDGVKVIEGLHSVLGQSFEIVGGYLGDGLNFGPTYQFHNGRVFKDAIAGLLICHRNGFRTSVGVRSGFESLGNRFVCTRAQGNVALEFDGKPALEFYRDILGEDRSGRLPEIALMYPFGLIDETVSIQGQEYFQLRCALAIDEQLSSLTLAGSIPAGRAITITTASRGELIQGAALAAEQAMASLEGAKPVAILMFSCVGRRMVLGRRTSEEVEAVQKVLGAEVPLVGFYSYGEIGPIDKSCEPLSVCKFHNETVVLWVLGEV